LLTAIASDRCCGRASTRVTCVRSWSA